MRGIEAGRLGVFHPQATLPAGKVAAPENIWAKMKGAAMRKVLRIMLDGVPLGALRWVRFT